MRIFFFLSLIVLWGSSIFSLLGGTLPPAGIPQGSNGEFSFTLSSPATTSAGVFRIDGTLIKTLWNDVKYQEGTYTKSWDGTDDQGVKVSSPNAAYQARVLTNNIQVTWQGTIGNTSTNMTGPMKHRGYYACMRGLAFTNTYGYFCTGFSEGAPSVSKFLLEKPQEKILFPANYTGRIVDLSTDFVATDNVNVYWGGCDPYSSAYGGTKYISLVYGTRTSDDTRIVFEHGKPYSMKIGHVVLPSVISMVSGDSPKGYITGLAVQKSGRYLFVARAGLNELQVLDKTTGASVATSTLDSPRFLCVDASDNLWIVTETNTVTKHAVHPDGTLSPATLHLGGLLEPMAIQVSPDGASVGVADGGASQQVKFFDNQTGEATSTLGTAGGYEADASVNDNKFYFRDRRRRKPTSVENLNTFIAYQPDGTFWISDPGNYRVQHFSKTGQFLNRIMSLGSSYSVFVDKSNITRIFSDFLEFEVDYSVQTLTGSTGWKLINNWGATAPDSPEIKHLRFPKDITTLGNGRTYGLYRITLEKNETWEVVEFVPKGQLRFTGVRVKGVANVLCSDGSLQEFVTSGSTGKYQRYPLKGFDSSGNPEWSDTPEILATAQTDRVIGNPVNRPNSQIFSSTDKLVLYNINSLADPFKRIVSSGYHLGVMKRGANNTYLFQTEISTPENYRGPYPGAGYFDVGNGVKRAGGNVNIVDRFILTSYHGEFWKQAQTNKYNLYYDNGLALSQFGVTRAEIGKGAISAPMMAGNALTPALVRDASGDLYLWHGDESDHAGIHRWKISGLDTIKEEVIPISYPSPPGR